MLSQIFLIIHHKPLVVTILRLLINFEDNQGMTSAPDQDSTIAIEDNITDEEKELRMSSTAMSSNDSVQMTPHLETILESLNPAENDYEALFGLSLLYAMGQNKGELRFTNLRRNVMIKFVCFFRCQRRTIVLE